MRKGRGSILGLLMAVAVTVLAGTSPVTAEEAGEVEKFEAPVQMQTIDTLNVRLSPSVVEGAVLGMLQSGETITVTGKVTDAEGTLWYEIDYQDQSCFVSAEFVSELAGEEQTLKEEDSESTTEEVKAEGDSEETTKKKKKKKDKEEAQDAKASEEENEVMGPVEQKSIVKTEDVPNTRAKGHGYRFITYSNGSFDVEVY